MKFTLSWLRDHLETDASIDAVCEQLTSLGLEVEGVEDPSAKLSAFRIAKVVSAEKHPNADKLRVCKVDTGDGILQVVCGAPNARTGMKGVFAPPGSYIPGSDMTLKPAKIRDVESNGMLCSERELELSDEHDGIIELPEDAPVGTSFAQYAGLDDPVIEVSITPNRPDCLGVGGIARDLAARKTGHLTSAAPKPVKGTFKSPVGVTIEMPRGMEDACPLFVGRYIRGVKNGPSPEWLQKRLRAIGLRPISALVDITNFISIDRARPLHVYDTAKLNGDIQVRAGCKSEKLLALDGKEYDLTSEMCVIADAEKPLGLGGVMGGEISGCTTETVNVFVESALFDPIRTALTGRNLSLESDARYRFERGVDPLYTIPGMEQATAMILDLCGGEPSELVIAGAEPDSRKVIDFRPERVQTLGGMALEPEKSAGILASIGFSSTPKGNILQVSVPSWRPDIVGEADIVEEVMRVHGYDHIPAVPMPKADISPRGTLTARQRRARTARRALAGRGLMEAVTWGFLSQAQAELFGGGVPELRLANPISVDLGTMRPSLLPNLIAAAGRNHDRGFKNIALFEVGAQFRDDTPEGQSLAAAGIRRGGSNDRHWALEVRDMDAFDAKADALAVIEAAGLATSNIQITPDAPSWYHPGRSGTLRLGPKNMLGYFGELHPIILEKMDVKGPLVGFEIFLDAIPYPKAKATRSRGPLNKSDFQMVERDFAFLVDRTVQVGDIIRAASSVDRKMITDVAVFDLYEGKGVGEDKKSVAISVRLQPQDKTLTEPEIEAIAGKIVAAVSKTTGGQLRS